MFRFKNTLLVNIKEYGISVFKYKKEEHKHSFICINNFSNKKA